MKKSFIDAFCNFMEDPDGLTKEDLIAELEDHDIDVVSLGIKVKELMKATQLDKGGSDIGDGVRTSMSLEKRVAKAYGADIWALDVTIRGPDPVGYWYLPGKLYKSQLRHTLELVYADQGLDIFIFTDSALVHCYYLSDNSVATAIIMPR